MISFEDNQFLNWVGMAWRGRITQQIRMVEKVGMGKIRKGVDGPIGALTKEVALCKCICA